MSRHPNSVDLIVTSPPYNIGTDYEGYDDERPEESYMNWFLDCIDAMQRNLKFGGRIAINISQSNTGMRYPLAEKICSAFVDWGFIYRDTIVWDKGTTSKITAWGSWLSPSCPYFVDTTEFIYVFSNYDKRHKSNTKPDITRDEFVSWSRTPWRFRGETRKSILDVHPAPFPLDLPVRLIKYLTYPGDVVFDPFMGSGTTVAAALLLERKAYGCDISKRYVDFTFHRISHTPYIKSDLMQLERILTQAACGNSDNTELRDSSS